MDENALSAALRDQDGVISRAQLGALGAAPHDVRRLLRRRELVLVHPGVYVDHTGPLTWQQRAQAAVLAHWPAALTRESALPSPPPAAPIQVAVDARHESASSTQLSTSRPPRPTSWRPSVCSPTLASPQRRLHASS